MFSGSKSEPAPSPEFEKIDSTPDIEPPAPPPTNDSRDAFKTVPSLLFISEPTPISARLAASDSAAPSPNSPIASPAAPLAIFAIPDFPRPVSNLSAEASIPVDPAIVPISADKVWVDKFSKL